MVLAGLVRFHCTMPTPLIGLRKTEDGRQKTEGGEQRTENGLSGVALVLRSKLLRRVAHRTIPAKNPAAFRLTFERK